VRVGATLGREGDTTAGVALGFAPEQGYAIAQLGAYNAAYAISEWVPSFGWRALASAGSITNLDRSREYSIEVYLRGQRITLVVDNVQVLEHLLQAPLTGDQIGLYAWGKSDVTFTETSFEHRRPKAFVAMPFSEPYDTVYREVIRPVAEEEDFEVLRIDEVTGPGIIFEDIKQHIEDSTIAVAEITAPNQNVFYELGYAHALNKPTILLAQRGQELPFDNRSYRVIFYDDSIGGKPVVERELRKHLQAVLRSIVG
jgi:hypothetical protein